MEALSRGKNHLGTFLNLHTNPTCGYAYALYFTEEETEAQKN